MPSPLKMKSMIMAALGPDSVHRTTQAYHCRAPMQGQTEDALRVVGVISPSFTKQAITQGQG